MSLFPTLLAVFGTRSEAAHGKGEFEEIFEWLCCETSWHVRFFFFSSLIDGGGGLDGMLRSGRDCFLCIPTTSLSNIVSGYSAHVPYDLRVVGVVLNERS